MGMLFVLPGYTTLISMMKWRDTQTENTSRIGRSSLWRVTSVVASLVLQVNSTHMEWWTSGMFGKTGWGKNGPKIPELKSENKFNIVTNKQHLKTTIVYWKLGMLFFAFYQWNRFVICISVQLGYSSTKGILNVK